MNKIIKYLIIIIVLGLLIIFLLKFNENRNYKSKGRQLIGYIENFRKTKGRLPNSINELNFNKEMGEGPYYEKQNDSVYVVYFNIGFDNSLVYSSSTGKWQENP